ncbi:hypothetical protein KXQ82_13710 [Mucilaginibacter sp. HMF5004]|uniref:hypothetical protein n=1 Tax=Mucilaginibacter rivuli TaxID=2857527 RepID=UPI001C5DAA55|nr:hypothetical protein [Mucilaginibacter rivuli]MBW4890782.1 hypothetical protein [Mucilaginibacter rivuli]
MDRNKLHTIFLIIGPIALATGLYLNRNAMHGKVPDFLIGALMGFGIAVSFGALILKIKARREAKLSK